LRELACRRREEALRAAAASSFELVFGLVVPAALVSIEWAVSSDIGFSLFGPAALSAHLVIFVELGLLVLSRLRPEPEGRTAAIWAGALSVGACLAFASGAIWIAFLAVGALAGPSAFDIVLVPFVGGVFAVPLLTAVAFARAARRHFLSARAALAGYAAVLAATSAIALTALGALPSVLQIAYGLPWPLPELD
jgi:hypothetical protein